MKIGTRKFGEIQIDENKILSMPEGLPGFPGFEKFVMLEDPKTAPFCWFQSVEAPNLALVIMDPKIFKPDYTIDLEKIIQDLGWGGIKKKDILVYVVVNILEREEDRQITANLMGPLVINSKNNQAVQVVISESDYPCQYDILEPEKSE
ncbi:flagellar assembly protein FliW [Desulfospira joergensenii]|uniref:flagellar assembly protein FliW n=1 Tax=Desulfospira joergensenii TaxID=53329 RepID=UPI0003B3C294|nr:flagellar assembly protein FliW [Desulfospira joergensenii]